MVACGETAGETAEEDHPGLFFVIEAGGGVGAAAGDWDGGAGGGDGSGEVVRGLWSPAVVSGGGGEGSVGEGGGDVDGDAGEIVDVDVGSVVGEDLGPEVGGFACQGEGRAEVGGVVIGTGGGGVDGGGGAWCEVDAAEAEGGLRPAWQRITSFDLA